MQYQVAISVSPQLWGVDTHTEHWTKRMVLGTSQFSQALCDTRPWVSALSVGCFQPHLKWASKSPDGKVPVDRLGPTNKKKKTKKVSVVPRCVIAGQQVFSHRLPQMLQFLRAIKGKWEKQKQLLLLEGEEALWDMSQIHVKESLIMFAVHRSARVFGCFFLLQNILNCYVPLFFSFLVNLFKVKSC